MVICSIPNMVHFDFLRSKACIWKKLHNQETVSKQLKNCEKRPISCSNYIRPTEKEHPTKAYEPHLTLIKYYDPR